MTDTPTVQGTTPEPVDAPLVDTAWPTDRAQRPNLFLTRAIDGLAGS